MVNQNFVVITVRCVPNISKEWKMTEGRFKRKIKTERPETTEKIHLKYVKKNFFCLLNKMNLCICNVHGVHVSTLLCSENKCPLLLFLLGEYSKSFFLYSHLPFLWKKFHKVVFYYYWKINWNILNIGRINNPFIAWRFGEHGKWEGMNQSLY